MNRYRWFRADWPISMRLLAKRLRLKEFGQGEVDGFVVDRVRDEFLEARYIERFELQEVVTDPFGAELTFPRVEFRQCQMRASSGSIGLELQDPPRGTHGLVSRLSEVNDFALAIIPISVAVTAWANEFQRISRADVVVDSLQIGGLEVEPGISAKVVLKGVKDVRRTSKEFTTNRRHTLERLQLRVSSPYFGKIILGHQGAAAVSCDRLEEIVELLRSALSNLQK